MDGSPQTQTQLLGSPYEAFLEQQRDPNFWAFCNPMVLFNVFKVRSEERPLFLKRNLSYSARPEPPIKDTRESVVLRVTDFGFQGSNSFYPPTVCAYVALCQRATDGQAFKITRTKLITLFKKTSSTAGNWVSFPVEPGPSFELVLIVWDAFPDITHFKRAQAATVTSGLCGNKIFGTIPEGARVWSSVLPLTPGMMQEKQQQQVRFEPSLIHLANVRPLGGDHARQLLWMEPQGLDSTWQLRKLWLTVGISKETMQVVLPRLKRDQEQVEPHHGPHGVRFEYSYGTKTMQEIMPANMCPHCCMQCNSLEGLEYHLHASHDLLNHFVDEASRNSLRPLIRVSVPRENFDTKGFTMTPDMVESILPTRKECQMHKTFKKWVLTHLRSEPPPQPVDEAVVDLVEPEPASENGEGLGPGSSSAGPQSYRSDGGLAVAPQSAPRPPSPQPHRRMKPSRPRQMGVSGHGEPSGSGRPGHEFYFHCKSAIPMAPRELELGGEDSDDEVDFSLWEQSLRRDLAARKSLTETERRFMYMWNVFEYHNPLHSDYVVPQRLKDFTRQHLEALQSDPGLARVFSQHIFVLNDYGLVGGDVARYCCAMVMGRKLLEEPLDQPPAKVGGAARRARTPSITGEQETVLGEEGTAAAPGAPAADGADVVDVEMADAQ